MEAVTEVTEELKDGFELPTAVLGKRLGGGCYKEAFAVKGRPDRALVVGWLRSDEVGRMRQLAELGVPTARVLARGRCGSSDALYMERYHTYSKAWGAEEEVQRFQATINERTIASVELAIKVIREQRIYIDDLQFLIRKDGEAVVADPGPVHVKSSYHPPDTDHAEYLRDAAAYMVEVRAGRAPQPPKNAERITLHDLYRSHRHQTTRKRDSRGRFAIA